MNQGRDDLRGDPVGADGEAVLRDVVRVTAAAFGERLVAGYALGSLAHGGFSPLVSDVDVALILADPARPSDRDVVLGVANQVRAMGSALHERVSIFWGTTAFLIDGDGDGRFPPLDRLCLFEHGRLLTGIDVRCDLPAPSRAELMVEGARFALDLLAENVVGVASDPAGLLSDGVRRTTKTVLFPVRFLFTADTGREGTNDAAVQHYSARHSGPAADLVSAAFAWRTSPPDRAAAAALLRNGFVPLYRDYLDDHIGRLRSLSEARLADRFSQWRSRLLGHSAGRPH